MYAHKVVGLLLRARKYQLVHFEGETLFQENGNNKRNEKGLKKPGEFDQSCVTDQFRVLGGTCDDMLGKD